MKKLKKILKWVGIVFIFILIAAILTISILMRAGRHGADQIKEVNGGVVQLRNLYTYIYGVKSGDKVLVFDGGIDERGDALDALLSKLGATRDQVTDVFLTHGHYDHVALAPLCKNARIHLGKGDVAMAVRKKPNEPRAARWMEKLGHPIPPVNTTDPMSGSAEFDLGGEKLLAFPLPGHTPGSYLFLWKDVLIVGDSIHKRDRLDFADAMFSTDLPLNKSNIAKLKDTLATERVDQICTGHEGCTDPEDTERLLDDLVMRASLGLE